MVVAYVASLQDSVTVFFKDDKATISHTSFRVLASASEANIQAYVSALQTISDLSITKYERASTMNITGQPAPTAKGGGAQFASSKAAMRLLYLCGADSPVTRSTLFGPKESVLTDDTISNYILDLADSDVIALAAAAVTVMVDTKGTAVTDLQDGRMSIKHRQR